jgi:DNA-binding GntR family transcriptional regulator
MAVPLTPEIRSSGDDLEDGSQLGSLTRQAYQRLRDLIVTLQLQPGALLNEAALMEQLQVGRTPLREALQRLAGEGLVVVRPRRGAFVASLSLLDLQQLFEVRREIEGYAARLAAERAAPADLSALQAALDRLTAASAAGDPHALIEVDRAFHRALARAAHNRFLESTLSRLYNLNLRLWYLALDRIGPMQGAVAEHQRVLDAVRRRDGAAAEAAIRQHITEFQTRIRALL